MRLSSDAPEPGYPNPQVLIWGCENGDPIFEDQEFVGRQS
jgi:hypothetical protein